MFTQLVIMELFEKFKKTAEAAGAVVEIISAEKNELTQALNNAIGSAENVVYAPPVDLPAHIFDEFLKSGKVNAAPSEKELETADVGISDAFAAVARTGSICLSLDHNSGTVVSLLPKKHIAVLSLSSIVARPRDVFELQAAKERDFVFISGPSATADMGELVRGAHGPAYLHIILLK